MDVSKLKEIPVESYMACSAKFNEVRCVNLADYFISNKRLCYVHYQVYMAKLFKNDYMITNCINRIDMNNEKEKIIYFLYTKMNKCVDNIQKKNILQVKLQNISYGIKCYTYDNYMIKLYHDPSLKIFRKLDMKGFKKIRNSAAKKSIHKHVPELLYYEFCKLTNCYISIYTNVSIPLREYSRYLTKEKIKELFINLAKTIDKFHNKAIILGDLDPNSIYVYKENIVFTNFYSNTENCNYYGEKKDDLKSNIFSQNIITSSLDSLNMKACNKLSDLESCMWLYMDIINHELIQKIKETINSSNEFSIQNVIKKKERFIKGVVKSNYLLQACNGDIFSFTEEVLRFINFFE